MRSAVPMPGEFYDYVRRLHDAVDLIVADGSEPAVFAEHHRRLPAAITHVGIDRDLTSALNGKVAGVLTGLRRCVHDAVIVADDDVRYDERGLRAMAAALDRADCVRPQNFFDPLPWHACLDTARTLLNRVMGGDWPGTLGVRRELLMKAGGYDGNVLFENLELVRTIVAIGGREAAPLGLYVRRLPPTTRHFWSQRVRQAYDEFARPLRLSVWLAVAPAIATLWAAYGWRVAVVVPGVVIVALAEIGRQRAGGARVFPLRASLVAPLWVVERAVCAWLAVAARVWHGGVEYRGRILSRAATPLTVLQRRLRAN
jgi:hypothetical protein